MGGAAAALGCRAGDVGLAGSRVKGLGSWSLVVARQNWHTSATGVTAVTLDTDASQEVVIGWQ